MLAAYFDDAGTHDNSRVVVWGGFLGTCEQWDKFDRTWRAKLASPLPGKPKLTKFGLADYSGHHGEFVGYSIAESDLLQNECRELVVQSGVVGVSYAIDRVDWDMLVCVPLETFLEMPKLRVSQRASTLQLKDQSDSFRKIECFRCILTEDGSHKSWMQLSSVR